MNPKTMANEMFPPQFVQCGDTSVQMDVNIGKRKLAEQIFSSVSEVIEANNILNAECEKFQKQLKNLESELASLKAEIEALSELQAQIAELKAENQRLIEKYDFQLLVKQNAELKERLLRFEGMTFSENEQLKEAHEVIQRLSECHLPKKACAGVDLPQVMLEENCAIAKAYLTKYEVKG